MRIAGGIIGIFLAIIIIVQSLLAGTANALAESGDSGGSIGFFVALLFVVGSALLLGKVFRGALGIWLTTAVLAITGGATTIFKDLIIWGVIAAVYAAGCFWGRHRVRKARVTVALEPNIA
jgi:hypothetical protein